MLPTPPRSRAGPPARSTPASRASVAVKSATVGVPSAAARWVSPVSTPTTSVARASSAANSGNACHGGTVALGRPAASRSLRAASRAVAPGKDGNQTDAGQVVEQHPPVLFRPQFRVAASAVHADRVAPVRRAGGRRGVEIESRRARRFVAERPAGKQAAAVDQMLLRVDAVGVAIKQRGRRLTDGAAMRPVHRPARKPGDQRTLDLLLQIDDRVVTIVDKFASKHFHLAPGRVREHASAPAAQGDGDDAADAAVQAHQRGKRLLGDPVDNQVPAMPVQIMHDRQGVHDVAQR